MKVAGFTFVRNAVKYDYPVVESIRSMLDICDKVIVGLGNSEDETEALVRSVASDKVEIFHSVWDEALRAGGAVLADETNKAMDHIAEDFDWCVYLQADEAIHENDHAIIRAAMEKYKDDKVVEGLLFRYRHFYGSYDYVGDSRMWYSHEIRVIRNDKSIRSYRDAQGFRKNGHKLNVKEIDACIYHYGWVKHPEQQMEKRIGFSQLYGRDLAEKIRRESRPGGFDYSEIDSLTKFRHTHPAVMQERIARKNWTFDHDISKKKFNLKGKLLHWIELKTGKRLFDYRNYRLLK